MGDDIKEAIKILEFALKRDRPKFKESEKPRCVFRDVGFTELAKNYPRDDMAIVMFAAFNNVRPDQLTEGMKYFPNASTAEAWSRVADAAKAFMVEPPK